MSVQHLGVVLQFTGCVHTRRSRVEAAARQHAQISPLLQDLGRGYCHHYR